MRCMCLFLGAVALLGPGQLSVADSIDDARVTARIETTLLLNEHLNTFDIRAESVDGRVTLTGQVANEIQKELAGDLAVAVDGADTVDNRIVVVPGSGIAVSVPVGRTFRQRVEDGSVSASVRTRLVYHRHFRALKIGVRTMDGVVTLSGIVPDEDRKRRIGEVAAETRGVAGVINNLTVLARRDVEDAQDVRQTISDEWVEKRVETSILLHRDLSIRRIDVEVNGGICVLSGTVESELKKTRVGRIAANIHGVLRLVNDVRVVGAEFRGLDVMDVPDEPAEESVVLEILDPLDSPDVLSEPLDW